MVSGTEKRYKTFAGYFKARYGERLQKLVIDAGFCCPNRDGTIGTGGCAYCDNSAFHPGYSTPDKSLSMQIEEGIAFHRVRYRNAKHYLAYFQPFSNTYAPLPVLRSRYEEALRHPSIVGIAIGTRPDCIDGEKLDYLQALAEGLVLKDWERPGFKKPVVIIEYGIESCYDKTLERINRCHDFETARRAVEMTSGRGIDVGAHFILGLPGETRDMMIEECAVINSLPLTSVKFHQLQFIKGTRMEMEYKKYPERFVRMELDEYVDFIVDMIERLRPGLYIERVAGEVPPRFVSHPQWGSIRNFSILHMLDDKMTARDTFQGRLCSKQ
ncbi:MAG: TIGR01212 family radical SAM protein [Bacteroidales bacterium]|jgi:radical SAM protein (TIGR01212 family)|nr:TIGR01212 family radical SAM protein [Bacteroidales bacterium]MCI1786386.1 TIGR01212 family radical SAM protein [Bacteroidales bacterium]